MRWRWEMDWLGFLRVMVIEEKGAQQKYQLAMELAEDPDVRALFERLRDEEAFHVQFLEGEYDRLEARARA
jgi:rubrerythrin